MVLMQHILIALEWGTFQNQLKNSYATKISQQIFIDYKHMIQWNVDNFELDLLILCLIIKI